MMQQRKQEEEFFKSLYAKLPDKIDELLFMLQNEVREEKINNKYLSSMQETL